MGTDSTVGRRAKNGALLPHLEAWRDYRMVTQGDLAKQIGVTRVTINRIERGGLARYATVSALAKALGVTPEQLRWSEPPVGEVAV